MVLDRRYDEVTQISVDGDNLPDDVNLVVTKITNKAGNTYKLLEEKVGIDKLLELYEITLVRNNSTYQSDRYVKIKLPLPSELAGRTDLKIAHFKDDGTVEYIKPAIKDDILEFETDSLSYFGIVTADAVADTGTDTDTDTDTDDSDSGTQAGGSDKGTPNTGDRQNYLHFFFIAVSLGVIIITVKRRKERRLNN